MKKKTEPEAKKPRRTPKEGGRRPSSGSAPVLMTRLVVQLNDTPHNRVVVEEIMAVATSKKVQGPHAVIKWEDVQVLQLSTTRPRITPPTVQATELAASGSLFDRPGTLRAL